MHLSGKKITINIIAIYAFFVSSIYMGVMWALHFFWYPGWASLTPENVTAHFIGPTSLATKFFTLLVPIMMAAVIVLVIDTWKTKVLWTTVVMFLGVMAATLVGKYLIIPINQTIGRGVSQHDLDGLLQRWMVLNNWRMWITTIMWLGCVFYFMLRRNPQV